MQIIRLVISPFQARSQDFVMEGVWIGRKTIEVERHHQLARSVQKILKNRDYSDSRKWHFPGL